jgi:hypothetical protein
MQTDLILQIADATATAANELHHAQDVDDHDVPSTLDLSQAIEAIEAWDPDTDVPADLASIVQRLRGAFDDLETAHGNVATACGKVDEHVTDAADWLATVADDLAEAENESYWAMVGPRRGVGPDARLITARGNRAAPPPGRRVEIDASTGLPPKPRSMGAVMDDLDRLLAADRRGETAPDIVRAAGPCGLCQRAALRQKGYAIFGGPKRHRAGCPNVKRRRAAS